MRSRLIEFGQNQEPSLLTSLRIFNHKSEKPTHSENWQGVCFLLRYDKRQILLNHTNL
jgi:hypothetical protein